MSNDTRKDADDDVLAWAVIGMVFGGVTLVLWGALAKHAGLKPG